MKDQTLLSFDDDPVVEQVTIQARFESFHERNPDVYRELVALARAGVFSGRTKLGIGQLFEVLRWTRSIAGLPDGRESFKLSNDYRSRYSRLIMEQEADLAGIFDTKTLTSE